MITTYIRNILLGVVLAFPVLASDDWNSLNKNSQNIVPTLTTNSSSIRLQKEAKINVGRFYDITQILPNIVIENGIAYTLDRFNSIVMINLTTNRIIQKVPLRAYRNVRPAGLSVFNGYIYISFENGYVVSFSLITNTILWETDVGVPVNSVPVLDENKVFVLANNTIYTINYENGELLWTYTGNKGGVSLKIPQTLTINGGYVMVGLSSSDFLVLQKDSGQLIWRNNLQGMNFFNMGPNPIAGDIKAPIVSFNDNVLVGSNNRIKYLDINDKQILWQNNNYGYYGLPTFYKGNVIVTSDNNLLMLSMKDGSVVTSILLHTSKKMKEKIWWLNPVLVNESDLLVANNIGEIVVLSIENNTFSQKDIIKLNNSRIEKTSNPFIIYQNKIISLSSKGYLYIYKVV